MKISQHSTLILSCVLFVSMAPLEAKEDYFKLRGLKQENNKKNNAHGGGGAKGAECPCGKCHDFSGMGLMETKPCVEWKTISQEKRMNPWGDQTCQTNTCSNGCCRAYSWLKCDQTGHDFPYVPCICNANTQDPKNFKPVTIAPIYVPAAGQGSGCPDDNDNPGNPGNNDKPGTPPYQTPSDVSAPSPAPVPNNLVDVALTAGYYSIFLGLLETTGLASTLREKGEYTVFGPTDSAWPQGDQLDFFLEVMDEDSKSALVNYHIVPGLLSPVDLVDGAELTTFQGQKLHVTTDPTGGVFKINGWDLASAGVPASNGVLYEMAGFFIP